MRILLLFSLILLSTKLYSQEMEQTSVQVRALLKRGISIYGASNSIDFGEIVLTNSQISLNKSPQDGLRFRVVSHPNKAVLINFNLLQLSSGETQNGPLFIPKIVHTGLNSIFIDPVEVQAGLYYQPQNQDGEGVLNLWVGGSLIVNPNNLSGDYHGTLVISITY